jgi:hypothetical protein
MQWSFGPVVFVPDDTGILEAKCLSGSIACRGYLGGTCSWNGERKEINKDNSTPDWCQYKESALEDAQRMIEEQANG